MNGYREINMRPISLKDPHLEFQFKPVLLALANYVLYLEMSKVDPRKAQQSAKKLVNAECANVTIKVVEPAPVQVTLFHASMKAA